LLYLIVFFSFY